MNVVPTSGVLSTATAPPIMSQKRFVIVRPSPVPPYRRVVDESAWANSSKTVSTASGDMPMPWSAMRMDRRLSSSIQARRVMMPPGLENLMELAIKLNST